ncbi:MAG: HAD family hydrolase [Candidatus Acidiferrales bacterium]
MNATTNNADGLAASGQAVRALIFDLDGTLIDSRLDLANSVNATLEHLGRPPLSHDEIFSYVGNGAPALIRRALGDATEEQAAGALSFFLEYYRQHMLDLTKPYPGVLEGLQRFRGLPMAVLTNKPVRFSRAILNGLDLSRFFPFVYGGNSFERKKPDPMGVHVILRDLRADAGESMMVGDSEVDVQTARNAGIRVCGVTYGLGSPRLADSAPDLLVASLVELADCLGFTEPA